MHQVSRWIIDCRIYLLRFNSPLSQKLALGRASVWLEDVLYANEIVEQIPSGFSGGVANYSGHNMRVISFCEFLNTCKRLGKQLFREEEKLKTVLIANAIVRTNKIGEFESACVKDKDEWNEEKSAILAVCSSSDKEEVKDALIHEAMHGMFYVNQKFRKFCYEFWETELDAKERALWINFLVNLRYNAEKDEEIAVNELQAYMSTERKLFEVTGNKSNDETHTLKGIQIKFSASAKKQNASNILNHTPSIGQSCKVVWM